MKARLAGGCGGHVEWSSSTPACVEIATLSECSGHRWPRRRGQQWKEQIRNNAIIGFGERCEHAAYPPGARGTAPLVRICPTAGCAITGSDARAAAAAGSARPHAPWREAEARGGFKGALAAPLAGHGQKSSGREPDPGRRRRRSRDDRDASTAREPISRIVRALERIPRPTFRIGKSPFTPGGGTGSAIRRRE